LPRAESAFPRPPAFSSWRLMAEVFSPHPPYSGSDSMTKECARLYSH